MILCQIHQYFEIRLFCRFLRRINGNLPALDESGGGLRGTGPIYPLYLAKAGQIPLKTPASCADPESAFMGLRSAKPHRRHGTGHLRSIGLRRHAAACRPDWRDPPPLEVAAPKSG